MQKKTISLILLTFLILIYMYTIVITSVPDKIVVFEGEEINIKTLLGLNLMENNESIMASSNINNQKINEVGVKKLTLNLFDKLPLKNINVSVLSRTKVIPVGNIAGVKLYTSGVLVVGMSEIEGKDNKVYKPYENTGIKEGDTITKINDKYIYRVQKETKYSDYIKNIKTNGKVTIFKEDGTVLKSEEFVGTGMKMTVELQNEKKEIKIAVAGDLDGNGKVTATDLSTINNTILKNIKLTYDKSLDKKTNE